ncbi:MAG TPA: YicC/YloC family endoribonuclease [Phycisphaerae bacterium]|nr:YicC/YloC family endoribonuclease [Phycisphaerae bacterium]
MIKSMTGFGSIAADEHGISCTVEIRSVNNRFFKAVIKLPDRLANLEPDIDRLLRDTIGRGSLVLAVSVKDHLSTTSIAINQTVLATYLEQIETLAQKITRPTRVDLAHLLTLPGVVEAGEDSAEYLATHQALVLRLVREALARLDAMRQKEGAALWTDLQKHLAVIRDALEKVAAQAPQVVRAYHEKLKTRVNQMVNDAKLSLSDSDLLKEVALFADRADISEEISRLSGHLEQFYHVCEKDDPDAGGAGRKLDFIAQEMLREANTIASKANDAAIARLTVNIKSAIDRIKEQVQNVE